MDIALLFPGQGSQYSGMGKSLCQDFAVANQVFEEASDVLKQDMKKLCFNDGYQLSKTVNAQPAILTVSLAAFRVYMQEIGIPPRIGAGHSLGEYSALVCSGALPFPTALRLVRRRGELMQTVSERVTGEMISLFHSNLRQLEQICDEVFTDGYLVTAACYNAHGQLVISGQRQGITVLTRRLDSMGIKYSHLNVSAAFHSPLMQEAANQLALEIKRDHFCHWSWPVVSNVDGLPYTGKDEIKNALILQMTRPVRWLETMEYMNQIGIDVVVELGPKTVLRNLMRGFRSQIDAFALGTSAGLTGLKSFVQKNEQQSYMNSDFTQQIKLFLSNGLAAAVGVPNRNENEEEYQRDGVKSYKKLKDLQKELEHNRATAEHLQQAVQLLHAVWKAKKVDVRDQREQLKILLQKARLEDFYENQMKLIKS